MCPISISQEIFLAALNHVFNNRKGGRSLRHPLVEIKNLSSVMIPYSFHSSDSISDTVCESANLLRYGRQLSKSLFLILVSFSIFDSVSPLPPHRRQSTAQATTLAQCSSCVSAYFAISARHCRQFFNPFIGRPKRRSTIPTVIFTGLWVLSWLHLRIKS